MQGGYEDYTDEEIRSVRDCVGDRLLRALDPLVRPAEIEASEDKLAKLRSLFLLLLGTVVGMRYTCSDVSKRSSQCNLRVLTSRPGIRSDCLTMERTRSQARGVAAAPMPLLDLYRESHVATRKRK
jgi:hypothetical protein